MVTKDYFAAHADEYARRRPHYPSELFEYLASVVASNELAWDCGTGSGQAAVGLAGYFDHVIATDPSAEQIRNAFRHPNVTYREATAEDSGIESGTIDLVTAAQALHWFDTERFFGEVGRVLKPGGVVAVWSYELCRIEPAEDAIVHDFYYNVVGSWPRERKYVDAQYKNIVFPFEELTPPTFAIELHWNLADLLAYIRTWSPVRIYLEKHGTDPVTQIEAQLAEAWGDPREQKRATFPINMRIGRASQTNSSQS